MVRAVLGMTCVLAAAHCTEAFLPGASLGLARLRPAVGLHGGLSMQSKDGTQPTGKRRPAGVRAGRSGLKATLVGEAEAVEAAVGAKVTDYFVPLVEGDLLESSDDQRKIVYGSFALLAALFLKGVFMMDEWNVVMGLETLAAVLVGYEFADVGSGIYHWSMDNYGTAKTPVFGTQVSLQPRSDRAHAISPRRLPKPTALFAKAGRGRQHCGDLRGGSRQLNPWVVIGGSLDDTLVWLGAERRWGTDRGVPGAPRTSVDHHAPSGPPEASP